MASEKQQSAEAPPDVLSSEYWFTPEFLPIAKLQPGGIRAFEWKDDDVLVVTVPRSGTHLTWIIARMLVEGSGKPILDPMEESHVWLPPFKDSQTGRRVLNTHFFTHDVAESVFKTGNRKFIYVTRNCKDVSVSQFNLFKKFRIFSKEMLPDKWEDYLPKFYKFWPEGITWDKAHKVLEAMGMKNTADETQPFSAEQFPPVISRCNWVNHVRAWENFAERNPDVQILFLHFEDIVRNFEKNIRKMAEFLSVPLSDELLNRILAACKFDKMKNAPVTEQMGELWAKGTEKSFYRKGTIGDWKNWYTVAQNAHVDEFLAKDMKGSSVVPIYE